MAINLSLKRLKFSLNKVELAFNNTLSATEMFHIDTEVRIVLLEHTDLIPHSRHSRRRLSHRLLHSHDLGDKRSEAVL